MPKPHKRPGRKAKYPGAAKAWGVTQRTIRNWELAGAPIDDPAAMRVWFSTRKNLPASIKGIPERPVAEPTGPLETSEPGLAGAASALRRLELEETAAYARLMDAMKGGDPIIERSKRDAWLKVSESLRKYDLSVEAQRRTLGEMISDKEVKRFFQLFFIWDYQVRIAACIDLASDLDGLRSAVIEGRLRRFFHNGWLFGICSYLEQANADGRFVEMVRDAIDNHNEFKANPETVKALVKVMRHLTPKDGE